MADIVYDIHIGLYPVILANIGARYSRYNLRLQLSNILVKAIMHSLFLLLVRLVCSDSHKPVESVIGEVKDF